ncbi:DoxX family protein [Hymenobacter latericus]|uniref:DoxX family protein n=1 Tax=Hymenobacter sp. YIM 151858-1 TaxID=2987688 RepID=UPI002225FB86|nr:DoxX family protein [Hymenobacter sp. YIM 151858-1]UYZ60659.1 DoxX family protein [Hymenobacter sp. YIM 151858-1]
MKKLLFSAAALPNRAIDAAWLLFRLHLGLSIADGAGLPKLTNLAAVASAQVPGPPDWFVQQVAGLGFTFPSPYFWAGAAVWGEFVGGLLIALGLFTRWSGLQLAFQFFVVAFIWYNDPSPITGMYYQQLLFWAFVVITAVGPGRYSLDYWLLRRRAASLVELPKVVAPRPQAATAALAFLLLAATAGWAGTVHSDLFIEPGKQFVLGGLQEGSFRVEAYNKGKVPVEVKERPRGGGIFGKATLLPGRRASLQFMAGSAAVLLNASPKQQANLALTITRGTGLSMNYEPVGQLQKAD